MDRRAFLASSAVLLGCGSPPVQRPVVAPKRAGTPPKLPLGMQIGDVSEDRAVVWSRADRKAQMVVAWTHGAVRRVELGPIVDENNDYCGVVELSGLPRGADLALEVSFAGEAGSEVLKGSFRTAGDGDVTLAWSGDTCGQGYGIDPELGGLKVYESMRKQSPHLFVHSGDIIYADNPIKAEMTAPDGTVFHNLVIPEKQKVAETLAEFRGAFGYHLLDENVRRFHREVPVIAQWDDHEIHNNWWPGQTLADPRYTIENKCSILAQRARRALFEYTPIRRGKEVQRVIRRGLLDVFVLDARSYRSPNGKNLEKNASEVTAFLGAPQVDWLQQELLKSKATWKVIACDQPVGLVIGDGWDDGVQKHEGWANGDNGPPRGREHEMKLLLQFAQEKAIKNLVFITADVHYVSANEYSAERGKIGPFPTFWEFVAGPLHAGGFGPSPMDETFGGKVMYSRVPPIMNQPPIGVWPSFGTMHVDRATHAMTVRLHDGLGGVLFEKVLNAA
jgi:alkaline phosphatase D